MYSLRSYVLIFGKDSKKNHEYNTKNEKNQIKKIAHTNKKTENQLSNLPYCLQEII
jgi:hypothetical protein